MGFLCEGQRIQSYNWIRLSLEWGTETLAVGLRVAGLHGKASLSLVLPLPILNEG